MKKVENILFFLTLLFLPTQLGKHFWPQFSFIYSLPIDYLSPVVYFWDLLVIILIIIFLLRQQKINKLALNIFLLFILTQVFSLIPYALRGSNLGAGLVRAEQYLIAGLFGVYLASKNINQARVIFIWGLQLGILGESILAILQFFKEGTLGLWVLGERTFSLSTPGIAKFDFYGNQFLRPYGTFPHPNVLAAFMVVCGLLLFLFKKKGKITSLWAGLTILLTVSRAAIVAGFVLSLTLSRKKIRILLILGMIVLLPILYTRFSSIFSFDNVSLLRREELSEVAIKVFAGSPFIGAGLNNFIPVASSELLVGPSRFLQPVHNIFLLSLAETGIVGFLGFLGLICFAIWQVRGEKILLLAWLLIIFLGMFDHFFLTLPQGYRLLFLLWGISLSAVQYSGAKAS